MPRKTRERTSAIGLSTITRALEIYSTKHYGSSCNRSPVQTLVSDSGVLTNNESSLYLKEFSDIRYHNSGFRSFNFCDHVFSESIVPRNNAMTLQQYLHSEDSFAFVGCGDDDYINVVTNLYDSYFIDLPAGVWAAELPNAEFSFSILDDTFFAKVIDLDWEALQTMKPEIMEGNLSIPVFLKELTDIRSLFRHLWSLLKRFWDVLGDAIKGKTLRQILKTGSSDYLATIFGWVPFYQDVLKMYAISQELPTKVVDFLEKSGRRKTYHYRKSLHPDTFGTWEPTNHRIALSSEDDPYEWMAPFFEEITFWVHQTRQRELRYQATMDYTYTIKNKSGLTSFLAEMDAWGINWSPSDIWEVIPFSFVIDYVINVGKLLERFDTQNVPIQLHVHDFCRSVRGSTSCSYQLSAIEKIILPGGIEADLNDWTLTLGQTVYRKNHRRYWRCPGFPVAPPEKYDDYLSYLRANEIVILCALLAQAKL